MKLLILGGTIFVGRHLVEAALARGHRVTLFNRGQTNPNLFPGAERLVGDRLADLRALEGRRWDAVIDSSAYLPRAVRATAERLANAVERYVFISSIAVYASFDPRGNDETTPLARLDEASETVDSRSYGPLKVACEEAVAGLFPDRHLCLRPGLIVGPDDPTDRFTYWPARVARGGDVLAPGDPDDPVQFIDVRDLAEWTIRMVEAGSTGTFNATGPGERLTFSRFLDAARQELGGDARFHWVDDACLVAQNLRPLLDLPLWFPPERKGMNVVSSAKAVAAGLSYRTSAETLRDTLAWNLARPADLERRAGLSPERERAILAAARRLPRERT